MTYDAHPVRAHDELRVQAALLRTPEFMAQFDPDKFAGQLERIAAALASAPPSAPVGVEGFRTAVEKARRVWMDENPCEDGHDHVTPFDQFLYGSLAQQPVAPDVSELVKALEACLEMEERPKVIELARAAIAAAQQGGAA